MIVLQGNGLNERHRDLNNKVNEAASKGVSFDDVKLQDEKSDADRLFKIKLADKYKNVEYIIETLKCGDSLYITKALKCAWLYDAEFSNIINPDYLEREVFPEMSLKMRRKFLTAISMHVTNDRAAEFYNYCVEANLSGIAIKFLLKTSEAFKVDIMTGKNKPKLSDEIMMALIGNSITLADIVIETLDIHGFIKYVRSLSHLYFLSNEEYLDMIEKNIFKRNLVWRGSQRLGLRISKHIIKNHRDRIIRHISLYINMLHKSMLVKCSSPDDVKEYISLLIPSTSATFWEEKIYCTYEYLLEIIPLSERYKYIKNLFNTHYPGEEFENDIHFYYCDMYSIMTKEERELWALKNLEENKEYFGYDDNFKWYRYVSFEKAFEPIKKYILTASDAERRNTMLYTLLHIAETNRELETLFNYYYQRHVNEMTRYKEQFVRIVVLNHNCFDFDEDCWNAFDKILHSIDVYDNQSASSFDLDYKYVAIIYAIIHEKDLHSALQDFIDKGIYTCGIKKHTDKLPEDKAELVFQYLMKFYLEKIEKFDIDKYDKDIENEVEKYIHGVLQLIKQYNKPKEDIPDIVMKYVFLNIEEYENQFSTAEKKERFTQKNLLKALKSDATLFVSEIPRVRAKIIEISFQHNQVLRKLRTYFSMDLAVMYMDLYRELLESEDLHEKACKIVMYGIFQIADFADRIDLIKKYVPGESKIDHFEIDRKLLYIRKAVCKYACFSRPIVPLIHLQKYIGGDYLKFCLPAIQSYASNLPPPLTTELIEFLLKGPASMQKHGIRLAFKSFGTVNVKKITDLWNATKNVSLRVVLYQALKNKITNIDDEHLQKELFEAFKLFTLQVTENDDKKFFDTLLAKDLPKNILGDHIINTWQVISTMPEKSKFIDYKTTILGNMTNNINLMKQDLIESIVIDHITNMFVKEQIRGRYEPFITCFLRAKWKLAVRYVTYFPDNDVVARKIEILQSIIKGCIKLWNKTDDDKYFIREFFTEFLNDVHDNIPYKDTNNCLNGIMLIQATVKELQESLPLKHIYEVVWSCRLSIILGKAMLHRHSIVAKMDIDKDKKIIINECVERFANELTNLINEYIERRIYYVTAIESIVRNSGKFTNTLFYNLPSDEDKSKDDVLVDICIKLVETERFETHYFALVLLPAYYSHFERDHYKKLISKMKSLNNEELNYLLYNKQVCDYRYDCRKLNDASVDINSKE